MSQLLYGFVEVLRDGRWHMVPEARVESIDSTRTLQYLLVDLFHHGPVIDEAILQLDTSSSELSHNWVDEAHLAEVLREHPRLKAGDTHGGAYQLTFATLQRFEWSRRLKWICSVRPVPSSLEDLLVKDAAGVERAAAGDARVADDVTRELATREFPILIDFPTASYALWAYESGSGRKDDRANQYLIYRSYRELLGGGFLEELLPAMERAVARADGQRPEHVRLVYWFE